MVENTVIYVHGYGVLPNKEVAVWFKKLFAAVAEIIKQ